MGVTIDDARAIAATLPRSYEALVRDELRFRVGRMVYAAFYGDETIMSFGSLGRSGRRSWHRSPRSSSCPAPRTCAIGGSASGSTAHAARLGIEVVAVAVPLFGVTPVENPIRALGPLGPGDVVLVKGSLVVGLSPSRSGSPPATEA